MRLARPKINAFLRLGFLAMLCLFPSCASLGMGEQTETPTISPTETAVATETPTRVWFPPTDTPIPQPKLPTPSPTADIRPVNAPILLEDDFASDNRWTTINAQYGQAAYGNEELTITVDEARRSLYSFFLEPMPANHYLELDASASLCRGEDMYGMVLRTQSSDQFYRLAINCNGEVKLDLIRGNSVVPIASLASSAGVKPGPLQVLRIGVWAYGDTMSIYINDVYQFSAEKMMWQIGGIGVFARRAADSALTVSFDDLVVREALIEPPIPTQAPTATPASN
ncbi:MAG: hypothetical protein JW750_00595 [Anaerolineaceae bacterium]|nr:hypothetical protein [Anaerolineaceae bacterium]